MNIHSVFKAFVLPQSSEVIISEMGYEKWIKQIIERKKETYRAGSSSSSPYDFRLSWSYCGNSGINLEIRTLFYIKLSSVKNHASEQKDQYLFCKGYILIFFLK